MGCINRNHPEIVNMAERLNVSPAVLAAKVGVWQSKNNIEDRFPTFEEIRSANEVNMSLKAVEILSSDKAKQVFEKGNKNNWDLNKILTELQIPKEQKQLILDLNKNNLDDIITDLLANYSYTVEINTSKQYDTNTNNSTLNRAASLFNRTNTILGKTDIKEGVPTQYYSNLTVPGGTNYTENEIATPAIIPSIKGHAQFATDNGIGWFRSDEQQSNIKEEKAFNPNYSPNLNLNELTDEELGEYFARGEHKNENKPFIITYNGSKTRRILEVQSDLFQKGRDKENLATEKQLDDIDFSNYNFLAGFDGSTKTINKITGKEIGIFKNIIVAKQFILSSKENRFLQLLNKDNNWVTFFIKSIIQDSVKKGYEKVLFPSGDTASKVEGHTTLEEFKKTKQDRLEILEKRKNKIINDGFVFVEVYNPDFNNAPDGVEDNIKSTNKSDIEKQLNGINNEINQLKQELSDIEGPGGFGALKPIYNFYENVVKNVLKKQGYKAEVITDEYGNTWNEVIVDNVRDESTITFKKVDFNDLVDDSQQEMFVTTMSNEKVENPNYENNKKMLFGESEITDSFTAKEVLQNIINDNNLEISPVAGFMLGKAMNMLTLTNAKVKIVSQEYLEEKAKDSPGEGLPAMMYDESTNTIYTSVEVLSKISLEQTVQAFIHEIAHSTSVDAYLNPKTFAQHEFKKMIDLAFEQYKYLANLKNEKGAYQYGFTNQLEFIAELYSNEEFQKEIIDLDKSFWRKLKDAVRRLFGLPKNNETSQLIDSILLINKVESFVENSDYKNFEGSSRNDYSKSFNNTNFIKVKEEKPPTNETLDGKIQSLYNKALDNTEQIMRRTLATAKKQGKDNKKYVEILGLLQDQLRVNELTNKWKGVNEYVNFMYNQIGFVNSKLKSGTFENSLDAIENFENYAAASDLLKPITELINDERIKDLPQELIDVINEIDNKITTISGFHSKNVSMFLAKKKMIAKKVFSNPYYTQEVVSKFEKEIAKSYPQGSTTSKKEWVSEQILGPRSAELDAKIEEHINTLIEGLEKDISGWDKAIYSTLNTSSRLIQMAQKMITRIKTLMDKDINDFDFKLEKMYNDFTSVVGVSKPSEMFKNIYEFDSNGQAFVKGKYSIEFRNKYKNEYTKMMSERQERVLELQEAKKTGKEISQDLKVKELNKQIKQWRLDHLRRVNLKGKGLTYGPATKYLNDMSKLSQAELTLIKEYHALVETSEDVHRGKQSLIAVSANAKYFELPKATISTLERTIEGNLNVKEGVKRKFSEIVDWRPEDVEQYEAAYDSIGNKINSIPVLFRNKIDPKEQSLDLFTLMRLENYNQSNHKHKETNQLMLETLVDIAKNKKFLKTESGTGKSIKNLFGITVKHVEFDGIESNTYKRLKNVVDQSLYNVFNEDAGKVFGKDKNKIVSSINGWVGFLGMSLNYFNAPVNVMNGEFQIALQKFSGTLSKDAISKAHAKYVKDLPNVVLDVQRPVKKALTNQLNLMFDVFGGLSHNQNEFIKTNILKAIGNTESLQVLQNGGEHLVQSVLNLALLDSIKVRNKDGKFIDKDGKVVEESKAASLLDMIEKDKDTQQISVSDKVVYTDKSTVVTWENGGFENVKLFIKKQIFDTMGEYDKNFQNDFQRHWYGQLASMYKKFFIPLGVTRYRGGISSIFTNKEDLNEDDLHWNEALQEYEEGSYITFGRLLFGGFNKGLLVGVKNLKYSVIKNKWENLSDYEKGNVKKALVEFGTITMLHMVIVPLLMAMAAGGDDDDLLYFALLGRRLEQELSQYTDLEDAYKITKNPIASLTLIEDILSVGSFAITPTAWLSTNSKDESRFLNAVEKIVVPGAWRHNKTAKNTLDYMNRDLIVPISDSPIYKAVVNE